MLCTEIKEKGKYDMKKVLKRLTGIVLSAAIALGAFTVNTYEVRAAEVIDGNQEYRIKISDGKEQSFTFSTPSDAMTIVETAVEGEGRTPRSLETAQVTDVFLIGSIPCRGCLFAHDEIVPKVIVAQFALGLVRVSMTRGNLSVLTHPPFILGDPERLM